MGKVLGLKIEVQILLNRVSHVCSQLRGAGKSQNESFSEIQFDFDLNIFFEIFMHL